MTTLPCAVCPKPITDEHDYVTLIRYDVPERLHIHERCFLRTNDLSRVWDSVDGSRVRQLELFDMSSVGGTA